jgi:hypothetical protein
MSRTRTIMATLIGLMLTNGAAIAQPTGDAAGNATPPSSAANQNKPPPLSLDQYCRRQAEDQTGYGAGNANSGSQQAYGSAYNACMESAANARPPAYYGGPAPYPYPYPYPYYYGPYYGGPAIGLSFGFGGWHGRWR